MRKKREARETRAPYRVKHRKIAVWIDPTQLARAPILLKQNGETVGAVISLEEYRGYNTWKKQRKPDDDFPPEWHAEKAAFQRMLPELLKTHREKFVAVYQGQLVDSDENEGELEKRMEQKYGDATVYVDEVLEHPRVYCFPSVWLSKRKD